MWRRKSDYTTKLAKKRRKCVESKNSNAWESLGLKGLTGTCWTETIKGEVPCQGVSWWISLSVNFQIIQVHIGWLVMDLPISSPPNPFLCVRGHLHQLVRKIQLILTKKWNYCWHWSGLSWHMGGKEGGPWGWWYTLGNTRIQAAWLGKALGMPGLRLLRLPRPISLEGLSQHWPTPTAKARRKSQGNLWLKLSGWKWQHEHAEKSNNALHLYL